MKNSPTNPVPADVKTLRQELERIFVGTKGAVPKKAGPKKNEPANRDFLVIKGK